MSSTTLRVTEPRELLAYLPHRLGFHPRESVVAVSLHPPRGRIGMLLRVDLADLADPAYGTETARGVAAALCADGADETLLVVYTDHDPRVDGSTNDGPTAGRGAGAPGADRAAAVRTAVRRMREAAEPLLGDVEAWVVTSTGYLGLDCTSVACCPPGGRPLAELEGTSVGAAMVLAGSVVAGAREDIARILPAPAPARRRVARVAARWRERGQTGASAVGEDGGAALQAWRLESLAAWREEVRAELDGGLPGGAPALGRIEVGLSDRRVRDAVLVSLVPGDEDLPDQVVLADEASVAARVSAAMAVLVDPEVAVEPQEDLHRAQVAVLEQVVAHGRRGQQAPALALLGLLAWWQGDGARAALLVERARQQHPGYRLAEMLAHALGAALPPGWVRRAG
ncbi:DUF4192 domain-containing protein [Cellulomonas hominis]